MPVISLGGMTFECGKDDTILRAALRAGLGFPYSCNVGSCGTCRFTLMGGKVEHARADPPAWTERDRGRNRWLGCQSRPLEDCSIELRLDPSAEPRHRPRWSKASLVECNQLTHDMREFVFSIDGSDDFTPGQYGLIEIPGVDGNRPYSMSNLPGRGEWRFVIKRVPDGAATGYLFEQAGPGARLAIDAPYGMAALQEPLSRDLLLVAGGSGLSPMISIATAVAARGAEVPRTWFFHGVRTPEDLCADQFLSNLSGLTGRLTYVAAVSDPIAGWRGPTGHVHEVVGDRLGTRLSDFDIYFAGPPAMSKAMQLMLHEAKVPPAQIHFDEFY